MKLRIVLIAVHYRNFAQTQAFLQQVQDWGIDIHIADNSAAHKPLEYAHPQVHIHSLPHNPGYFGAVQSIWERLGHQSYDYVIVSNTDLSFSSDFLTQLQTLQTEAAVIAPSIQSSISGKEINPLYTHRPNPARMRMLSRVFKFYLSGALWQCMGWLYAKLRAKTCQSLSQEIYAAHGSLMIFAKPYFQAGLDFNYPIFLYGEEIWVAEHCQNLDLKTHFLPQLKALHKEHGSLGIWPSYKVWQAHRDSNNYMLQHFFNHEN